MDPIKLSDNLIEAAIASFFVVALAQRRKQPSDNVRLFRMIVFCIGVLLFMASFAVVLVHAADPNPLHTPGVADPALTKEVICAKTFRTGLHRRVTQKMHKQVWSAYGLDWDKDHSCCEDDHLISIELGGSNDNRNRWPQPWAEARLKDKVENYLHKEVCSDTITLDEAQKEISGDWRAVYEHMQHSDHAGRTRLR